MVAEVANTRVSVLRGTTVDEYGDPQDANIPIMNSVPAALVETGHTVQDPSTPTPRTIRKITCHVPAWTGISDEDRIRDERTGELFMIIGITRPPSLLGAPVDLLLDLKRITAEKA